MFVGGKKKTQEKGRKRYNRVRKRREGEIEIKKKERAKDKEG